MFNITVPVKPHIKRIIETYYPEKPRKLTPTSTIGVVLCQMLTKHQEPDHPEHYKRPPESVTFHLSEFTAARTGFELSDQHIYQFNTMIDKAFREQVFLLTTYARHINEQRTIPTDKAAIEWLNSHYNIFENDLAFDTLKKSNYRRMKAREKKRAVFFL